MKNPLHFLKSMFFLLFMVFLSKNTIHSQNILLSPTVKIDSSNSGFCFGDPIILTCSYTNADGVLWYKSASSDGIILGSVTSTQIGYNLGQDDLLKGYFVIYVRTTHSAPQTPAIDSLKVRILPPPIPDFSIDTIIQGKPVEVHFLNKTNFPGGIASWQWDFGNGQKAYDSCPVAYYNSSGSYTVKLRAITEDGCENTEIKTDFVQIDSNHLGIKAETVKYKITIYPNPAKNLISVLSDEPVIGLKILDIQGREIRESRQFGNKYAEADISSLTPGIYLLGIVYSGNVIVYTNFLKY